MKKLSKQLLAAGMAIFCGGSAYAVDDPIISVGGVEVVAAQWLSPTDLITLEADADADIYYAFSTSNSASREPAEYQLYTAPFTLDPTLIASSNGNTYLWYYVEDAVGDESTHKNINLRYSVVVNSLAEWKNYAHLPSTNVVLNISEDAGVGVAAVVHNQYYNYGYAYTSANCIYLWDGKDGALVYGNNINGDAMEGTVQYVVENSDLAGKTVYGTVMGALTTASTNAGRIASNHQTASTAVHYADLAEGTEATPAPLALTLADLQQALDDGDQNKYAYAYVRLEGVNVVKKNNTTYVLKDGDSSFDLSDGEVYFVQAQSGSAGTTLAAFMASDEGYADKKGNFTGIVRASGSTYLLMPVHDGWFEVTGVAEREQVELDANSTDNPIAAKTGVDVTLKNRTFRANMLNTFYAPLQLDKSQFEKVFGEGARLYQTNMYNVSKSDDGKVVVGFNEYQLSATTRTSGFYNFIVIPTQDVVDPVFENVAMQNVTRNEAGRADVVYFWGTANATELRTDGTHKFLGAGGQLLTPEEGKNTLGGFRCYFEFPAAEAQSRVVLSIDGVETSVRALDSDVVRPAGNRVYTLGGQYVGSDVDALRPGVYVVNGRKYVVE